MASRDGLNFHRYEEAVIPGPPQRTATATGATT